MGLADFIEIPVWKRLSKKAHDKINRPSNCGLFSEEDADERNMRLAIGQIFHEEEGCHIMLSLLVDTSDGIIVDAKFQLFGSPTLIAALDAACDLLAGKNVTQAKRLSVELVEKNLRDKPDARAFPEEVSHHLNLTIEAIGKALQNCGDISQSVNSPLPRDTTGKETGGYPGWQELSKEQKLGLIDSLFNEEIRPYIELDSGGIEILDLVGDKELIVSYQGACTSCYSSIGSTLSTIQQIVQEKIHPDLVVVPNLDDLKFN